MKPQIDDTLGIAMQLWDCCPNYLDTIVRSNSMGNNSTEPKNLGKMLTKIKAISATT